MTIQQMFVAFSCLLLATQQIAAVVNNPKSANLEDTSTSKNVTTSAKVPDSKGAGTEQEAIRREAPIGDTYGLPLIGGDLDSYVPTGLSNPGLPLPVYGAPDASSNNIIYPAPPPDIPPPLPPVSTSYGLPVNTYLPPQTVDLGSSHLDFVPPPPPAKYGPPLKSHKQFISNSFHGKPPPRPRPQYGPPHKPIFVPKGPKPTYGPPRPLYGSPKPPLFAPQTNFKQQSVTILTVPSTDYGVPQSNNFGHGHAIAATGHYGPPEPVAHGPPHPGVPAPPTPPDIKYDGWQPIPGLVSRPPSDSYGVPGGGHHGIGDLQLNADFVPPPIGHGHVSTSSHHHSLGVEYSPPPQAPRDSYGAPLNSVTGSGAIVTTSGDAHHDDQSLSLGLSAAGINGQSHLSVIKSIGYELFPNPGGISHIGDSYSSPPLSSYSANGPYAASHSYKTNGISSSFDAGIKSHHNSHFHNSHGSHGHSFSSSNIGLIPPSGFYGTPPSGHYGTPLLSKPSPQYGAPLNALKINPPKHPVVFREPVPTGLIESIGQHTAHKDAHGVIESSHGGFSSGPAYIPPPVPDVTKPVREEGPPEPTHLYSLPNPTSSVSFQNIAHGSLSDINSFALSANHFGVDQGLTSYTAPLGSIDGSYSLPIHTGPGYSIALDNAHHGGLTVGIDNTLPPLSIDLTSSTTNIGAPIAQLPPHGYGFQGHDCQSQGSQPLPSLSYGVPSANTYTAALSALTTNIGGVIPSGSYGTPDLETEHSQKVASAVSANVVQSTSQGKTYGKSLAQEFGPDSELVQSESIDINNIPVKGNIGSYTLQIQSADSLGSAHSSEQVSHAQVLNGGLLESILAAIEHPRKDATILGHPLSYLQPSQSYEEPVGQHSVTNAVVVTAPATEATSASTPASEGETEAPLRLIDNNEIALYFSNSQDDGGKKNNSQSAVRNGQQYGSYVSFKTPNGSFSYGNLPSDKKEED